MYILCFLQIIFPYYKNKKCKEGKIPKRKIKGLERKYIYIYKSRKWNPNKKEIKIKHESDANPNATTIYFYCKIKIVCNLLKCHNP